MLTMEKLIREQEEIGSLISRMWLSAKHRDVVEKSQLHYSKLKVKQLDEYWAQFVDNHRTIVRQAKAAQSEYVLSKKFENIESEYFENFSLLSQHLDKIAALVPVTHQSHVSDASFAQLEGRVRLPKIDLPKFSGNLFEWESFRDQFRSTVHECSSLSNVQKLTYLQRQLAGEAAEVIKNTPITDSNHLSAWKALESRYGNPLILSSTRILGLIQCPPAKTQSAHEI